MAGLYGDIWGTLKQNVAPVTVAPYDPDMTSLQAPARTEPDDSLREWASGYLPSSAAVEIILSTTLRPHVLQHLPYWHVPDEHPEPPCLDWGAIEKADQEGRLHLSSGNRVLYDIVSSLLTGTAVALQDLWRLDERNRAVVLRELGQW